MYLGTIDLHLTLSIDCDFSVDFRQSTGTVSKSSSETPLFTLRLRRLSRSVASVLRDDSQLYAGSWSSLLRRDVCRFNWLDRVSQATASTDIRHVLTRWDPKQNQMSLFGGTCFEHASGSFSHPTGETERAVLRRERLRTRVHRQTEDHRSAWHRRVVIGKTPTDRSTKIDGNV